MPIREGLREGSNSSLPQLESSVYGPCSYTEGEGEGKSQKNLFFEKYYSFLCRIKNNLYFCPRMREKPQRRCLHDFIGKIIASAIYSETRETSEIS